MSIQTERREGTITIVLSSTLPPERVLATACDFSPRRERIFPAVSLARMTVHSEGPDTADVSEGTRSGPIVNWERCRYDWSQPHTVTATVTDSNIYATPGSAWTMRAHPSEGGSRVEMVWERRFLRTPKGRLFGFVYRHFGERLFGNYAAEILRNIEATADTNGA